VSLSRNLFADCTVNSFGGHAVIFFCPGCAATFAASLTRTGNPVGSAGKPKFSILRNRGLEMAGAERMSVSDMPWSKRAAMQCLRFPFKAV